MRPLAEEYPTVFALSEGRVSGRFSEWPTLKPELRKLLEHLGQCEAALQQLKKAIERARNGTLMLSFAAELEVARTALEGK